MPDDTYDSYVDDNETIYVSDYIEFDSFGGGNTRNARLGLADIGELSGQSTWFVNSVKFSVKSWISTPGTTDNQPAILRVLCGVAPYDYCDASLNPTKDLNTLLSYQEIKGWPMKGCSDFSTYARDNPSTGAPDDSWQGVGSNCTWTKTYRPRDALVLSRMQQIYFVIDNIRSVGANLNGWMSIEAQLKRGD